MSGRAGGPQFSRQTSFARSFFQAGAEHDALKFSDDDDDEDDRKPLPQSSGIASRKKAPPPPPPEARSPMIGSHMASRDGVPPPPRGTRRRSSLASIRSTRSMSIRFSNSGQQSSSVAEAAAAVRGMHELDTEGAFDMKPAPGEMKAPPSNNHRGSRPSMDRQPSWLKDLLEQGVGVSEEMLAAMGVDSSVLQQAQQPSREPALPPIEDVSITENFGDNEVMEQYKIMAQFGARSTFRDKTGCDVDQFVEQQDDGKRRAVQAHEKFDPDVAADVDLATMLNIPKGQWNIDMYENEIRPNMQVGSDATPNLPPMSQSKARDGLKESLSEIEEAKQVTRGTSSTSLQKGIAPTTLRCVKCKTQLSIHPFFSLVKCPNCGAVNPNDSTRL